MLRRWYRQYGRYVGLGSGAAVVMVLGIGAGLDGLTVGERVTLLALAAIFAGGLATVDAASGRRRQSGESGPRTAGRSVAAASGGLFQLPRDINDFVGHEEEVRRVSEFLAGPVGPEAVRVAAIAGKVGVGKTAFAIHVAHQLRDRFPDGSLFVDLRGADTQPLDVREVLAGLLRELEVPRPAVPERLEERARLYRARMSGRRMLVVLDDVADETQVRPLLPGGPGCSVLVTRREPLVGLADAHHLTLDELDQAQSIHLLERVIGEDRVAKEPTTAAEVTKMCGYLPLALRIVANKLASRRHWTMSMLASRLRDERRLLGELSVGDQGIRASIALSYNDLTAQERKLFRLLAMLDVQDVSAWVAAALLDCDLPAAETLTDRLADMQLLVASSSLTGPATRFGFHTLIQVYARERLAADDAPSVRTDALRRALRAYTAITERAYSLAELGDLAHDQHPPIEWTASDPDQLDDLIGNVTAWFAAERANLIAIAEQGHAAGLDEEVCRLAISLYGSFNVGAHWHAWKHLYGLALISARRTGDRRFEAEILLRLGDVYKNSGRVDGPGGIPEADREDMIAAQWLQQSREVFSELGDRRAEVAVARRLGGVYRDLGYLEQSRRTYEDALVIAQGIPDEALMRAYLMRGYGCLQRMTGQLEAAMNSYLSTVDAFVVAGDVRGRLGMLRGLGETYVRLRRWDDAEDCFREHLKVDRELGDRHSEAHMLNGLGEIRLGKGEFSKAVFYFEACLPTFHELEHRVSEAETLTSLGVALLHMGRRARAQGAWERARQLYRLLLLAPEADGVSARIAAARRASVLVLLARRLRTKV